MTRGQWIAVGVLVVAVAGLVLARTSASDDDFAVPDLLVETAADETATGEAATDSSAAEPSAVEPTTPTTGQVIEAPPDLGEARDLTDLDGWLQTEATSFDEFDGTVRVVQFWTFSCINCKNTLANLAALYDAYEPLGLEVIGVHAPEFSFEEDPVAIQEAATDLGVDWPIALDTRKTNFRSWQSGRRFWPRTFVIDSAGQIRFDHIGEGAYDELNATVAYLIENGA